MIVEVNKQTYGQTTVGINTNKEVSQQISEQTNRQAYAFIIFWHRCLMNVNKNGTLTLVLNGSNNERHVSLKIANANMRVRCFS